MSAPTPGWYPDPSGAFQYWDGYRWQVTVPAASRKKNRWGPFLWALAIVGVLTVGLVTVMNDGHTSARGSLSSSAGVAPMESNTSTSTPSSYDLQRLDPSSYSAIGLRDYALLIKDPDAHIGEKVIIYGAVEQFDSSTGNSELRATTMAYPHPPTDDDEYNALIEATSDPSILANVVSGDFIRMYVVVDGTESYTSTIGAELTVPKFSVNIINVMHSRS
jgi:hypothetical protein